MINKIYKRRIATNIYLFLATAINRFNSFKVRRKTMWRVGIMVLAGTLIVMVILNMFVPLITTSPTAQAVEPFPKTVKDLTKPGAERYLEEESKPLKEEYTPDKEKLLRNLLSKEITTPRIIQKTTKGKKEVEFIFHKEPRVRIKLEGQEIEFETKYIDGKSVNPKKAKIFKNREVIYEDIAKDIDLKYTVTNDLLVEEFILKKQISNIKNQKWNIEQTVNTTDIKVVWLDNQTFGFYSEEGGKEIFKLSSPFAKDAKGEISNDLSFTLDKGNLNYTLKKTLGKDAIKWLSDPKRAYPVSIDPSVIVSGGIVETEVQYGGLQRKLAYMSGANGGAAWYALHNDGAVVDYKRCLASSNCDESSDWINSNTVTDGDTDNYNPSISVSGNYIIVFWIDDSGETVEGRRFDTSTSVPHTLGTLCTGNNQGTIGSTFMVAVAAVSATEAVVAFSDTSTDTEFNVFDVTGLDGTCAAGSFTTDLTPGNITFGSGITAGDRPVVVPVTGNIVDMIFQDGNLSYSRIDVSLDEWTRNNLTLASVTDTVYSVVSDGSTIWILTVSGTTATSLYACCVPDFAEGVFDNDAGGNSQDISSDIDMFCVSPTDCKIVYTDDIDVGGGGGPDLVFVDCDTEDCATNQQTILDTDIGGAGDVANPAIYCVDAQDCKIVYGDNVGSAGPDQVFLDCTSANEECTTSSATVLNADIGAAGTFPTNSIDCTGGATDCKVVYWEDDVDIVHFVDCSAANCSTTDADTSLDDNASADIREYNSISCATGAGDCKVVFHDTVDGDLTFIDCTATTCASPTIFDINASVGTADAVTNDIWCPAADGADCKVIYHDETANSLVFVDCGDIECNPNTSTTIDSTAGFTSTRGGSSSIQCISVTDCKFVYDNGGVNLYFVDCDAAACDSGSVIDLPGPRAKGAIQCPATANCKFAYYDGTASSDPIVQFADCDVTNCFPTQGTNGEVQLLDGNTGCVLTSCSTTAIVGWHNSISCPTAADCKISYYDASTGDLKFADCDNTACSSGTVTLLDGNTGCVLTNCSTTADVGAYTSISCPTAADCKISYYDGTTAAQGLKFADCDTATCSSGTVTNVDGNAGCVLTNCSTSYILGEYTSISCPTSTDCKISYYAFGRTSLKFADCDTATCSSGTVTILDGDTGCVLTSCSTTASVGSYSSISCPTSTDCKISYYDGGANGNLNFADCADGTPGGSECDSGTATAVESTNDVGQYTSITCPAADDCKISHYDNTNGDLRFFDCGNATCSSGTANFLDGRTSCVLTSCSTTDNVGQYTSIACPTAADCKIGYYDVTNTALKFADCDADVCSSGTVTLLDGNTGCVLTSCSTTASVGSYSSISCPTAADCKISYYDGTTVALKFADCDNATCVSITDLADPWTSQTNVTSVSLTYDSTNFDLYAHIIKNTSEQAYFSSSDGDNVSWVSETSYGFTAGDLGHISANLSGAGATQIGVVLRQGSNFEFASGAGNVRIKGPVRAKGNMRVQ